MPPSALEIRHGLDLQKLKFDLAQYWLKWPNMSPMYFNTLSQSSLQSVVLRSFQGNLFLSLNRPEAAVGVFRIAQALRPDLRSYQGEYWVLLYVTRLSVTYFNSIHEILPAKHRQTSAIKNVKMMYLGMSLCGCKYLFQKQKIMGQMVFAKNKKYWCRCFFSVSLIANVNATCEPWYEQCKEKIGLPNLAAVAASNWKAVIHTWGKL